MVQCLVLFDVMLWGERFIYSKKQIISDQNAKMVAYLGVAVLFGLIAFNYFALAGVRRAEPLLCLLTNN